MMRSYLLAVSLAATALVPGASAQPGLDGRVDRLEKEMRAVQRTVFPGGAGKYVSPDITAPDPNVAPPGTPATNPVADLDTRIATLERQQATLTGQIEQNQFRIRQLEESFAAYKRTTDARLGAAEPAPVEPAAASPSAPVRPATVVPRPTASATPKPAAVAKADPARAARVAEIERPTGGDPAEDAYLYGYRLWEAKLYPEAQASLKDTVAKYPKHRRASYAQNLLGRAYLDDAKPSLASMALYDSFKKYPDGDRAPDSLYYLGQALMKLEKPVAACQVYAELDASYGAKLTTDLKAKAARGRADAKCK